jgi:hypothetical protein
VLDAGALEQLPELDVTVAAVPPPGEDAALEGGLDEAGVLAAAVDTLGYLSWPPRGRGGR